MILRVEHTTEFGYDGPIAEAYTELRLRPLEGGGQHCSSFRLITEPPGLRVREYRDHFGNDVHHFDVLESHDRLAVTAVSEVMTPAVVHGRAPRRRRRSSSTTISGPTDYAPFAESVREFAARHTAGSAGSERARALMSADPRRARLRPRGDRRPDARRRGARARPRRLPGLRARPARGLPLRRHPGALRQRLPLRPEARGRQRGLARVGRRVGRGARAGSRSIPTHDREQSESYVRVAVGRDYADVPPTRGVYKGQASETLAVRVGLQAL